MSDIAIRVDNLGKLYRIGATPVRYRTFRDSITEVVTGPIRRMRARQQPTGDHEQNTIWALKNISFDVKKGQVLGVIGRNGAGKSTLLKILSRITEPTTGIAEIRGRVGSLLEVGTGFHPELTGRENIFLNGAILGMKGREIEQKFDEIVAFSEVEKFIDTPVKRYSSGMYLRLAFAVAAHLEPEILVVDEVLAVGDAEFQRKCLGKMSNVAQEGRTVLFVSHNMSAILRLTEETIVLDKGEMLLRAPTQRAVDYYLSSGFSQTGERHWQPDEVPAESYPFHPISMKVLGTERPLASTGNSSDSQHTTHYSPLLKVVDTVRSTESFTVEIEYHVDAPITGLRVGVYLITTHGELVFTSFDTDEPGPFRQFGVRETGHYTSRCMVPADLLNEGRYVLGMNASSFRIRRYFQDESALSFNVDGSGAPGTQWTEARMGPIRPRLHWEIQAN